MTNKSALWTLHRKAEKYGKPPSELVGVEDAWTAYQFDNAVLLGGTAIENALQETVKIEIGSHSEYRPRYTLSQLLDKDFRLPRPTQTQRQSGFDALMDQLRADAGKPNSRGKLWRYVGPTPEQVQ